MSAPSNPPSPYPIDATPIVPPGLVLSGLGITEISLLQLLVAQLGAGSVQLDLAGPDDVEPVGGLQGARRALLDPQERDVSSELDAEEGVRGYADEGLKTISR